MVVPWRAILLSLAIGFPLAGPARAQDLEGAPVIPDLTEGMTGSTRTLTGMAYANGPATTQAPGSTSRVVLPNPAAQAPPSPFPPAPQPPSYTPQPPSYTPEPPSYVPQLHSLLTPQGPAGGTCGNSEDSGTAAQCDGAGCCCNPLWTLRADAVFLSRSAPPGRALIGDELGGTLLNAGSFDPGTATGWDISVIRRRVFDCWGIEGLYFDDSGWNNTNTFTAPGGSTLQFATPIALGGPSTYTATCGSALRNLEVNGRYELADWLDFIAGFRYLELGESLNISQTIGALSPGSYSITAHNRLPGFQLGMDAHLWDCCRFSLDGTFKAGIFNDDATNSALLTLPGAADPLASAASKSRVAGLAELDFAGTYHISDDWAIRGGYQLLWIDGVALASSQVAVSNPILGTAAVDDHATAFYHGAFVGLEFRR